MSPKKIKIRNKGLKSFESIIKKKLKIDKINPLAAIEKTKSKIGNFYENLKKEREKEKRRLEKKRKLDEE